MAAALAAAGLLSSATAAEAPAPGALGPGKAFVTSDFSTNPYDRQVAEQIDRLRSALPAVRAGAAEALGFLRAYSAADALVAALRDEAAGVRREAAMALAWCGGRASVRPLLAALALRGVENDGEAVARFACSRRFRTANVARRVAMLERYIDVARLFGGYTWRELPTRYLQIYTAPDKLTRADEVAQRRARESRGPA